MRKHVVPFYSWMEINAPRYARLAQNAPLEGKSEAGAKARIGATLGKKAVFKTVGLTARALALYSAVALWNRLVFPEEDEEFNQSGRDQMHLMLGRYPNGDIRSLRFQGALTDAMGWAALENPLATAEALSTGDKTATELAEDMLKAAPQRLFLGSRPFIKGLYEVLAEKSFYPDPWNPRPIRDRAEHIARIFSLDKPYKYVKGRPKAPQTPFREALGMIQGLVFYSTDPGESAYWAAKSDMYKWLKTNRPDPKDRSDALYYLKRSIRLGDAKGIEKYSEKYVELGGTMQRMEQSIKLLNPMRTIPSKDQGEYVNSLSKEQYDRLVAANKWYVETYR
jgi:hypothetical protein